MPLKGFKHTEETRKKMSLSKKGKPLSGKSLEHILEINARKKGIPLSEETKYKMSEADKGRPSPNKGKKASEETRKKISENHRHYQTEEAKKKMSKSRKGKKKPEGFGKKISKCLEGNKNNLGHKHTLESIGKMRLAARPPPTSPTKPELELFKTIKSKYPNKKVVMNHLVKTQIGNRFIDVAIPELMLGWEYDEPHWHQDKEKDIIRHLLIEAEGWQLTHYSNESEFC